MSGRTLNATDPVPAARPRPDDGASLSPRGLLDAAAILMLAAAILGFAGRLWWGCEILGHFRPQYLLGFTILGGIYCLLRRWRWAILCGAMIIVNAGLIVPLYLGGESAPEGVVVYRVILANVYSGNREPREVIDFLRAEDPDIIVLEEVTSAWMQRLSVLGEAYPVSIAKPAEGNFGILLLSRLPLVDGRIEEIGMARLPSVVAQVQTGEGVLNVIGTHPLPPIGSRYTQMRNEQIKQIARRATEPRGPILLVGDLNTTSWSGVFRGLVRESGLRDSRRGFGVQPTWPSGNLLLQTPLDHILVSPEIVVHDRRVGPHIGSDHLPVILDFSISPAGE